MITKDIVLMNEVFSILDSGIIDGYDFFCFEVEVGDGYIDTKLTVERDGFVVADVGTDINDAELYGLVRNLKLNASQRGDSWKSFAMCYRRGGQVKTNFKYD